MISAIMTSTVSSIFVAVLALVSRCFILVRSIVHDAFLRIRLSLRDWLVCAPRGLVCCQLGSEPVGQFYSFSQFCETTLRCGWRSRRWWCRKRGECPEFLGSTGKEGFGTFPGRRCPKLNRCLLTLESYFFALDLLDDLFDLDSDGEKSIALKSMVGIAIDDAAFSDRGLSQEKDLDGVEGLFVVEFGSHWHLG